MFNISEELKKIPEKPGVYLMHGKDDEIIYIGKAKVLKKRVSQYFQSGRNRGPKIEKMVSLIEYFEYIVTDTEVEALILENNLIKENRPRYNTMLKDDKTYPYIRLTLSEDFPRLVITRKPAKDKDKYYGPYPAGTSVKSIIELLCSAYGLRTCRRVLPRDIGKERPCLNYHIGKCPAPCAGSISKEEYAQSVNKARRFLEGNPSEITAYLKEKMYEASERMEYEKAGEYKELIKAAQALTQGQLVETDMKDNRDVLGLAASGFDGIIQIFFIRAGKLLDREYFYVSIAPDEKQEDIAQAFVKQYYSKSPFLPAQILLPCEIEDKEAIGQWLSQRAGHKVSVVVPEKGKKEKMVELASENARIILERDKEKVKRQELRTKGAVAEISKMLGINYAKRIESFDISNISGYESVGSMVVFEDGKPKKNDYRKFKIKTVAGPDDYASMAEVLERRLGHLQWGRPDMFLIDGGKGQVNSVKEVIERLSKEEGYEGIENIPVCGMVKDDNHRTRGLYYENKEYVMDKSKEPFKLITRIQDETHRFAIEYHRMLRSKGQVRSVLDDIEGIGPKRRTALIRHFKSIDNIKEASLDELASVEGMNMKAAESVKLFFTQK